MSKRDEIARSRERGFGQAATSASGVAAQIRAARKLRKKIRWPGTDIEIGLKILSQSEIDEAHAAARSYLAAVGIESGEVAKKADLIEADTVGAAVTVQLLARALFESAAEDAPRLYPIAEDFAKDVTAKEMDHLLDEYLSHELEIDSLGDLPEEVFEQFCEAAKKKDRATLNSTAGAMPWRWLRSTAVRLATSLTSSSSTPSSSTSSADDSTSSSNGSSSAQSVE